MKLPRKPSTGECTTCADISECDMRSPGVSYCAAKKKITKDPLVICIEALQKIAALDSFVKRGNLAGIYAKEALEKIQ